MLRHTGGLLLSGLLTGTFLLADGPTQSWPIAEAPARMRATISRADVMIAALQDSHLRQLREQLHEGGPALAFGVCHLEPAALAQRVRHLGIRMGFTSDRLRNERNSPAPWASALVQANAGRRARDVEGFAADLGDTIGVLRPMVAQRTCAACHGEPDDMAPDVQRLIAQRYPKDRAVGFVEGEIRGWFWVEMPKAGQ